MKKALEGAGWSVDDGQIIGRDYVDDCCLLGRVELLVYLYFRRCIVQGETCGSPIPLRKTGGLDAH